MKFRTWYLPLAIALVFTPIHVLPESESMIPSAVSMKLPDHIADWELERIPASKEEIETLAPDTEFSKAICYRTRTGEFNALTGRFFRDRLDLSIVLSGHDLNNSIHRPERCMPSQGHTINQTTDIIIPVTRDRNIKVRRLLSVQTIPLNQERTEFRNFDCVTYYFFVGNKHITHDHYARTLLDMKDRLLHGLDQRWAYVSVSMWYGDVPWVQKKIHLEEADLKIRELISELGKDQIDWQMLEQ